MNNEAFAGFLLKKTIQNFPIREETDGDFNEFRDRNIIIYLQKKFGDLKKKTGQNISQAIFANTQLPVKPKVRDNKKGINAAYKLDKDVFLLLQKYIDKEKLDNLVKIGEAPLKKPKSWRKKPISINQKLSMLIDNNITEIQLQQLYKNYERQNFKATLNELRGQIDNPKEFKTKFQSKGLNNIDFEDQEQVNFFMNKLFEEKELDACALLDVKNDNISFKKDEIDEKEVWKNIVQKRITQEQMHEILMEEEKRQNQQLVKIFKETRIDQFDPDIIKSKVKMTTMKRVTEAQDQEFQRFFTSSDIKKKIINKEDFYRKRKTYGQVKSKVDAPQSTKSMKSFSTRPQTCVSRNQLTTSRSAAQFNIIGQCEQFEKHFQNEDRKQKVKLNQLDNLLEKAEQYLEDDKPLFEREPNRQFEKFKKERLFKKKFIHYAIDKVEKPADLLSLKVKTELCKKIVDQALEEDDR